MTAIELMPVADFPGERNWGYDGVCLFAPARAYGRPDDLRALVDARTRSALAVILDVVYNHLGPEGAYLPAFSPDYFTETALDAVGRALNSTATGSELVRRFVIDNALHWIREYHVDGLRLDATHALVDDEPAHFVTELARARARSASTGRSSLIAEDHRNLRGMIDDPRGGRMGLDGVWADDFHHVMRRLLAGDAQVLRRFRRHDRGARDESSPGLAVHRADARRTRDAARHGPVAACRCVASSICLQNHDQVGNRACGDRLHHAVDPGRGVARRELSC